MGFTCLGRVRRISNVRTSLESTEIGTPSKRKESVVKEQVDRYDFYGLRNKEETDIRRERDKGKRKWKEIV